jgi:hypothetical protein
MTDWRELKAQAEADESQYEVAAWLVIGLGLVGLVGAAYLWG